MKPNPQQRNPNPYRSPANVTSSRGLQPRPDDGFHTRPVRRTRNWRSIIAVGLLLVVCVVAVIFVL